MALSMFAFFVLQALFVGVERRLGIRGWPIARRRAWTLLLTLASAPLFLEPLARVLGV
jgi:hypothetical protein